MSHEARSMCGLILILVPTIVYGGLTVLGIVSRRDGRSRAKQSDTGPDHFLSCWSCPRRRPLDTFSLSADYDRLRCAPDRIHVASSDWRAWRRDARLRRVFRSSTSTLAAYPALFGSACACCRNFDDWGRPSANELARCLCFHRRRLDSLNRLS